MFILVTCRFPLKSAADVGKTYEKRRPLPPFVKLLHVLTRAAGEMKVYALYEVEKGKEWKGYETIGNRFIPNFDIEGFKFDMEVLMTINEAFPMLGLTSAKDI